MRKYNKQLNWKKNVNRRTIGFYILLGFIAITCSNTPIDDSDKQSSLNILIPISLYIFSIFSSFYFIIINKK